MKSFFKNFLFAFFFLTLLACNNEDDNDDDSASTTTPGNSGTVVLSGGTAETPSSGISTTRLSGRASDGNPIAGESVLTQCGSETQSSNSGTVSGTDGTFEVTVPSSSLPCVISVVSSGVTLSTISTSGNDANNINPVSQVVSSSLLTSTTGRTLGTGRSTGRTLSTITRADFETEGKNVLDQVFQGGIAFSDFDKSYTDTAQKEGANLADTLFRAVESTQGGLNDLVSIITKANDASDTTVTGRFLNNNTFQVNMAAEIVAFEKSRNTDMSSEIANLTQVATLTNVKSSVSGLIDSIGPNNPEKGARMAGSMFANTISNTAEITDIDQMVQNLRAVAEADTEFLSFLNEYENSESEGIAIAKQMGATLASADKKNTAYNLQSSTAAPNTTQLGTLSSMHKKVREATKAGFNQVDVTLTGNQRDRFLEELAETTMELVLEQDTDFLFKPDEATDLDRMGQNTGEAFNGLEVIFGKGFEADFAEEMLESAAKNTKNSIGGLVAGDPTTNKSNLSQVGQNVGTYIADLALDVAGKSGISDQTKLSAVMGPTMDAAFENAFTGQNLWEFTLDLNEGGSHAGLKTDAQGLMENMSSTLQNMDGLSENMFGVMIQGAAGWGSSAEETQKGFGQIARAMAALEELGFDVDYLVDTMVEEEVEMPRLNFVLEIMQVSFYSFDGNNPQALVESWIEKLEIASDSIIFATILTTVQGHETRSEFEKDLSEILQSFRMGVSRIDPLTSEDDLTNNADFQKILGNIYSTEGVINIENALDQTSLKQQQATIVSQAAIHLSIAKFNLENQAPTDNPGSLFQKAPKPVDYFPPDSPPKDEGEATDQEYQAEVDTNLEIFFDQKVEANTGQIKISYKVGEENFLFSVAVTDTTAVSFANDDYTVVINPPTDLQYQKQYHVQIDRDAFQGKPAEGSTEAGAKSNPIQWDFRTKPEDAP